jgi:hypothetical protein
MHIRHVHKLWCALLAAVLVVVALQWAPTAAHADGLPLDKANWVVSVAGFRTDAYRNYMRLGYVVFDPASNSVQHNFWTWNQADDPVPVNSGDVFYCGQWTPGTNPRNNCPIQTSPGFTGDPNGHFTGTYSYTATDATSGTVAITWTRSTIDGTTTAVNLTETWSISQPRPGLGRMSLLTDSTHPHYSLSYGIGYGSNASLAITSKATMAQVRTQPEPFLLEGQGWNGNTISSYTRGSNGGLSMANWNLCDDGSCLGHVQLNAGCSPASCCPQGPTYNACAQRLIDSGDRRFYYMSDQFGGRRNTYEYWCECLSYNGCYLGNSHIKPLLQVIDDGGAFQGWVGVEVSPDRSGARDEHGEYYASYALIA